MNLLAEAKKRELTQKETQEAIISLNSRQDKLEEENRALKKELSKHGDKLDGIENEWSILPGEADDIEKAIRQKCVELMGGKKSNAYNNTSLRKKIFMDCHLDVKRNYYLITETGRQQSYKHLKRKYYKQVMTFIGSYELPIGLSNEVAEENEYN